MKLSHRIMSLILKILTYLLILIGTVPTYLVCIIIQYLQAISALEIIALIISMILRGDCLQVIGLLAGYILT